MAKKSTKESVYEEIRKAREKGKTFKNREKIDYSQALQREGHIKKVGKRYYFPEFAPTSEIVYRKVREAGREGISLKTVEMELIKSYVQEERIKTVYRKYYASEFAPLKQKEVIERLLSARQLQRFGKTYFMFTEEMVAEEFARPPSHPMEVPSFLDFSKKIQEIYLRMGGGYRQSVKIIPIIEELTSRMKISRAAAEKWFLELPRIFLGRVDLRPFPGEKGLKMDDGSEVARVYLERGIVGL